MRLTLQLLGASRKWLLKQQWLWKGKFREPKMMVPQFLQEKGVDVLDVTPSDFAPLLPPPVWEPPIKDPRFTPPSAVSDHPDWHEETVYDFNHSCRLIEGVKQALILTKSQPQQGLPQSISDLIGQVELPYQDELVQRVIMQANVWDPTKEKLPRRFNPDLPIWRFKAEWGIPHERLVKRMIYNLIRLCRQVGGIHGDLMTSRRTSYDHYFNTYYHFQGHHIRIGGTNECLVSSSRPLMPFASEEDVDMTTTHSLPDIFPIAPTIDLQKTHIWREENMTGWQPGFSHSEPHTLFMFNPKSWKVEELNARALMYSFAYSLTQAKERYGADVSHLPEPVCVQCVHTDGVSFHLLCFQLNTLDFSSQNGIKNIAWFDSNNAMYKKIEPKRAMLRNTRYEDYNPQVFQKLLALYINNAHL